MLSSFGSCRRQFTFFLGLVKEAVAFPRGDFGFKLLVKKSVHVTLHVKTVAVGEITMKVF